MRQTPEEKKARVDEWWEAKYKRDAAWKKWKDAQWEKDNNWGMPEAPTKETSSNSRGNSNGLMDIGMTIFLFALAACGIRFLIWIAGL